MYIMASQSFTKREYSLQSTAVDQIGLHMGYRGLEEMWLLLKAQSITDLAASLLDKSHTVFENRLHTVHEQVKITKDA